jgi:hypothetical protein
MSISQDKITSHVDRLRKQIAEAESVLGDLRAKLAKLESKQTGAPPPATGLDILWKAALPMSRLRSSKHRCRVAWNRIPKNERPTIEVALAGLKAWNRCDEWKKDNNQFAPGLQRYISERMWEELPDGCAGPAPSRYRSAPKPLPPSNSEEAMTREEIAQFLSLTRSFSPTINPVIP